MKTINRLRAQITLLLALPYAFAYAQPEVSSITIQGDPGPGATSVTFEVVFSESVTNVTDIDFVIEVTDLVDVSNGITQVQTFDGGLTYEITVDGISGDGWLRLDVSEFNGIVSNLDGTPLAPGGFTGNLHYVGAAFDISRAFYAGDEERFEFVFGNNSRSTEFSNDGTMMFIPSQSGIIYAYELTTAFDISTATYSETSLNVGAVNLSEIHISPGGTYLFVNNLLNQEIVVFEMSEPYNLNSASLLLEFNHGWADPVPFGMTFSRDGTRMFLTGLFSKIIRSYDLTTPFDLNTAIPGVEVDLSSIFPSSFSLQSISFAPDGFQLYTVTNEEGGSYLSRYNLTTSYDVSLAALSNGAHGQLYVSGQLINNFTFISFSNDGTRMIVSYDSNSGGTTEIVEYTLLNSPPSINETQSDQSVLPAETIQPFASVTIEDLNNDLLTTTITLEGTGALSDESMQLEGAGPYTLPEMSAADLQTALQGLVFEPASSGTTTLTLEIYDGYDATTDATTSVIVPPGISSITIQGDPGPGASSITFEIVFSEQVDNVDPSDFDLQISELVNATPGVLSSADGTTYTYPVNNISGDGVIGLDLLNENDISTTAEGEFIMGGFTAGEDHYVGAAFDVGRIFHTENNILSITEGSGPLDFQFINDGTRMFVLKNDHYIYTYDLDESYEPSSATFSGTSMNVDVDGSSTITAFTTSIDGTKLFVMDAGNGFIEAYQMEIAYDLNSANLTPYETFSVANEVTFSYSIDFSPDGLTIFIVDIATGVIHEYTLNNPYEISSAVPVGNLFLDIQGNLTGIAFRPDGLKLYALKSTESIFQYSLPSPYEISLASLESQFDTPKFANETGYGDIEFNNTGTRMYATDSSPSHFDAYSMENAIPSIQETQADQIFNALDADIHPFSSIAISDLNNDLLTTTITVNGNGALTDESMQLDGTGPYTLPEMDATSLQAVLRELVFEPAGAGTTTFTLEVNDGFETATDASTSVTTTSQPYVESITVQGTPGPAESMVNFEVLFVEPVSGVDVDDFLLETSEKVMANLTGVTGADELWTVTIDNIQGDGWVRPVLKAEGTGIEDMDGNEILGGYDNSEYHIVGAAYDLDRMYPGFEVDGDDELVPSFQFEETVSQLHFSEDGSYIYVVGGDDDGDINQYQLLTPFDLSTTWLIGQALGIVDVNNAEAIEALELSSDGTKLFVFEVQEREIRQFNLSTPYNITTASLEHSWELPDDVQDFTFSYDGSQLFILFGGDLDEVRAFELGIPYDLSTVGEFHSSFHVGNELTNPSKLEFSLDGKRLFVYGVNFGELFNYHELFNYQLDDSYNLATVQNTPIGSHDFSGLFGSGIGDFTFHPDGTRLFAGVVYEYILENAVPEITGTEANQLSKGGVPVNPFANVTVTDLNNDAIATWISLDDNAKGSLSGGGIVFDDPVYTLDVTNATNLSTVLQSITFTPDPAALEATTVFEIQLYDGYTTTIDNTTSVISTEAPAVQSIVLDGPYASDAMSVDFLVTFDEAVDNVTADDFSLHASTSVEVTIGNVIGAGALWTVTVNDINGFGELRLDINETNDIVDQDPTPLGLIGGYTNGEVHLVDFDVPGISEIYLDDEILGIGDHEVDIDFSEGITSFPIEALSVINAMGTFSPPQQQAPSNWTTTFTPTNDQIVEVSQIEVDLTLVTDVDGGNPGVGTFESLVFSIDTQRPTATIGIAVQSTLAIGDQAEVTITLTEPAPFNGTALTVPNGNLSDYSVSEDGLSISANYTPEEGVTEANNMIELDMSQLADAAGNAGDETVTTLNFSVDTERPSANISLNDDLLIAGESAEVLIEFSEVLQSFGSDMLSAPNGTLSPDVVLAADQLSATVQYTPNSELDESENVISLNLDQIQDLAGNSGEGEATSENFIIDTTVPTVTLSSQASGTINGLVNINISFSEAVDGFNAGNISVTNGSVSAFTGGGTSYMANINPTAAAVTVLVEAGATADLNGNANTASNQLSFQYVPLAPVLNVTGDRAIPETEVGDDFQFTLTVQNTGNVELVVSGITYPEGFSGPLTLNNIPAGGSETITVTFSPTVEKTYAGDIVITSNGGVETLAVTGVGKIVLGTDELSSESVMIYPNPSDGEVNLTLNNDYKGKVKVRILDLNGKQIVAPRIWKKEGQTLSVSLLTKELKTGVYLAEIRLGSQTTSHRIVISSSMD